MLAGVRGSIRISVLWIWRSAESENQFEIGISLKVKANWNPRIRNQLESVSWSWSFSGIRESVGSFILKKTGIRESVWNWNQFKSWRKPESENPRINWNQFRVWRKPESENQLESVGINYGSPPKAKLQVWKFYVGMPFVKHYAMTVERWARVFQDWLTKFVFQT